MASDATINKIYDRISDAGMGCVTLRKLVAEALAMHPDLADWAVLARLEISGQVATLADIGTRIGAACQTGTLPQPVGQARFEDTELGKHATAAGATALGDGGSAFIAGLRRQGADIPAAVLARTLHRANDNTQDPTPTEEVAQ